MNILNKYQNGDTEVTIYEDGTKERVYLKPWGEEINIIFPESIDLKITNYCNLGCKYCHEQSTRRGIHGDLKTTLSILDTANFPEGIELAIGGGNPLDHPDLKDFLLELKSRGFISNITINQGHLKPHFNLIKDLITDNLVKGVGVSLTNDNYTYLNKLYKLTPHIVIHVIAGVNNPSDLFRFSTNILPPKGVKLKFLILGYKSFGFGKGYIKKNGVEVEKSLGSWSIFLGYLLNSFHLSFDNLAIEQLSLKKRVPETAWIESYMGDDFTFTMYMDAVTKVYAPTSRSEERTPFEERTLLEFFSKRKPPRVEV